MLGVAHWRLDKRKKTGNIISTNGPWYLGKLNLKCQTAITFTLNLEIENILSFIRPTDMFNIFFTPPPPLSPLLPPIIKKP